MVNLVKPGASKLRATIVVPTYNRPNDLSRCIRACLGQTYRDIAILVVARKGDQPSIEVIERHRSQDDRVKAAFVDEPGQVAALNAGLREITSEFVCITDDDAAPRADWVARIIDHFDKDLMIGAVGGRDIVREDCALPPRPPIIGKMLWYGKMVGNHHLGWGGPCFVQVLKGANMSYRVTAIDGLEFDTRLKGRGAQVANDMGFSLSLARRGGKLLYDPMVIVDHYPATRFDEDARDSYNRQALYNSAYNECLVVTTSTNFCSRLRYIVYSAVAGSRSNPGLVAAAVLILTGKPYAAQRGVTALRAKLNAVLASLRSGQSS